MNKTDTPLFSSKTIIIFIPREMFIAEVDQSMVDDSTERWLDTIEESTSYKAWFCGHWHTDKRIDRMHFLFHGYECSDQFDPNRSEYFAL